MPSSLQGYYIQCENHGNLACIRSSYNEQNATYLNHFSSQALVHSLLYDQLLTKHPTKYVKHHPFNAFFSPLVSINRITRRQTKILAYNLIGKFGVVGASIGQRGKKGFYQTPNNVLDLLKEYSEMVKQKFNIKVSEFTKETIKKLILNDISQLVQYLQDIIYYLEEKKENAAKVVTLINKVLTYAELSQQTTSVFYNKQNVRFPKSGTWQVIIPLQRFHFVALSPYSLDEYLRAGGVFYLGKFLTPMKITYVEKVETKLTPIEEEEIFPVEIWPSVDPPHTPPNLTNLEIIESTPRYTVIRGIFSGKGYPLPLKMDSSSLINKIIIMYHDELVEALSGVDKPVR